MLCFGIVEAAFRPRRGWAATLEGMFFMTDFLGDLFLHFYLFAKTLHSYDVPVKGVFSRHLPLPTQ